MSLAEIREQIAGLTVEERLDIAAMIAHLNRTDDPEYQAELDQRAARIESGKKASLQDFLALAASSKLSTLGRKYGDVFYS